MQEFRDGHWQASIPLPFYGLFHVRCDCGRKFWGLNDRRTGARYREHYERAHVRLKAFLGTGRPSA